MFLLKHMCSRLGRNADEYQFCFAPFPFYLIFFPLAGLVRVGGFIGASESAETVSSPGAAQYG